MNMDNQISLKEAIELSRKFQFLKLSVIEQQFSGIESQKRAPEVLRSLHLKTQKIWQGLIPSQELSLLERLPDWRAWDKERALKLYKESGIVI